MTNKSRGQKHMYMARWELTPVEAFAVSIVSANSFKLADLLVVDVEDQGPLVRGVALSREGEGVRRH